jgi:hypothetical protein
LSESEKQLSKERFTVKEKQDEVEKMRVELNSKSIEVEREKSKVIIMEANLEAKEH